MRDAAARWPCSCRPRGLEYRHGRISQFVRDGEWSLHDRGVDDDALRKELEERPLEFLVVRDLKPKAFFAVHAVIAKGVDEKGLITDSIVKDIDWMGCARVIFKSDNEPAIVKVVQESIKALKVEGLDQAGGEHPSPYNPKAKGGIEEGVKFSPGMTVLATVVGHC